MDRLTIDEIIEHCERKTKFYEEVGKSTYFETAELTDAIKEYWEHKQVKEYLEELKAYREIGIVEECKGCVLEILEAYNKAIDDFIHECDKYCGFYSGKNKNITREDILKIAEQLKAGVRNES